MEHVMAMQPRIKSKAELTQYILRKLGAPVINIEVTPEQIDDAIADTLEDFLPRAYSGMNERFVGLQLIAGQTEYTLPYAVYAVLGIWNNNIGDFSTSSTDMFSANQFIAADIFGGNLKNVDMLTYSLTQAHIETMGLVFGKRITFDFNCTTKKLYVHEPPKTNFFTVMQYYIQTELNEDPGTQQELSNLYDNRWIKRMATERTRYQWGENLSKYQGSVLPNGMTLNGEGIKATADANMEKLMQELHDEWELPVDFFIG